MYKLMQDQNIVMRLTDNAFIPVDKMNNDYQEYVSWLLKGNIPEPIDIIEEK